MPTTPPPANPRASARRGRLLRAVVASILAVAMISAVVAGIATEWSRSGDRSDAEMRGRTPAVLGQRHAPGTDQLVASDDAANPVPDSTIDPVEDASPGGLSRFFTRIASAVGVDRLGPMTGGLIDAQFGDGRIAFRVDTDAPTRSLVRALQGVRQFAGDAAAHAQALVTGRTDALIRIVAQNGEIVVPIADDGTLSLDDLVATPVGFFASDDAFRSRVSADSNSADSAGAADESGLILGDAVVLLVQGARDSEFAFAAAAMRQRPDRTPCAAWGALTPALLQHGHRVVVLEERDADETDACARIATVLGALREIGVTDVDVVARRSGIAVVERYLQRALAHGAVGRGGTGGDSTRPDHSGVPGDRHDEATILRRVVVIGGCVDDGARGALAKRRAFDVVTERRRVPGPWRGGSRGPDGRPDKRDANRHDDRERGCVEIFRVVASSGNALHQIAVDRTRAMHLQSPRPQPSAMLDAVLATLASPVSPAPDRALAAADCLADDHSH